MRIYEYSKKAGVSNKEIIRALEKKGFEVKSHMSILPDGAQSYLNTLFLKKASVSATKEKVSKKPAPEPSQKVPPSTKPEKQTQKQQPKDITLAKTQAKEAKKKIPEKKHVATKKAATPPEVSAKKKELVLKDMTVAEFAEITDLSAADVIMTLLKKGVVAAKNQVVPQKVIKELADELEIPIVDQPKDKKKKIRPKELDLDIAEGVFEERLPIVVVVGHVDHGKTTLLDYIRRTRLTAKEKGGITQHIGAYEASTRHGNVVFLDTPGHEAFTKLRERGTRVADLAILIIAADDGIMPQTKEAIRHIEGAGIPLVVAINKIDRATPQQIESVKQGLSQFGLVPEEWGGQTVCVPISAKEGTGVDELLEVLVLQSKLMELTAAMDVPARGFIIEAKKEKGRGSVATGIVQHGILHIGDFFTVGRTAGKVTSLTDSSGKRLKKAHPGQPVQITGFDQLPQAGDVFLVVSQAEVKRFRQQSVPRAPVTRAPVAKEVRNIIVKADNDSSREALLDGISTVNKNAYVPFHVIHSGVGDVTDSDVQLAFDTNASIYTLHSKSEVTASALALKYGIAIQQYDIIYKLLESLQELAQQDRPKKKELKKTGEAVVLKVFDIKKLGIIAGVKIRAGRVIKGGLVKVFRGKDLVGEGEIVSLQREKKAIKEALTGFECAFKVEGFEEWQPDDRIECYQEV